MTALSYAELRAAYRPESVRVLLIGESAPDPGAENSAFSTHRSSIEETTCSVES